MFGRKRRRDLANLRSVLVIFERAECEMVRVWLRGRLERRAAVCRVGYPIVRGDTVTLLGPDDHPRATVRIDEIAAIERVFWANPPAGSRWFRPHPRHGHTTSV